jgi:hypothetical protein
MHQDNVQDRAINALSPSRNLNIISIALYIVMPAQAVIQMARYPAPGVALHGILRIAESRMHCCSKLALSRFSCSATPAFAIIRQLAMRFCGLLRGRDPSKLDAWLDDACGSGLYGMRRPAQYRRRDVEAVRNAISESWRNGQTEGQINRLKTLKRAMYGRAGTELLRARMLPLRV